MEPTGRSGSYLQPGEAGSQAEIICNRESELQAAGADICAVLDGEKDADELSLPWGRKWEEAKAPLTRAALRMLRGRTKFHWRGERRREAARRRGER